MINNYLGQILQNYLGLELSTVLTIVGLILLMVLIGKVGK